MEARSRTPTATAQARLRDTTAARGLAPRVLPQGARTRTRIPSWRGSWRRPGASRPCSRREERSTLLRLRAHSKALRTAGPGGRMPALASAGAVVALASTPRGSDLRAEREVARATRARATRAARTARASASAPTAAAGARMGARRAARPRTGTISHSPRQPALQVTHHRWNLRRCRPGSRRQPRLLLLRHLRRRRRCRTCRRLRRSKQFNLAASASI